MAKIMVLDDDQGMREFMEIMLTKEGYDVTGSGEPAKAIDLCRKTAFDLVITDLKMPKINGIEFLKAIKDQRPETIVILITAYASGETAIDAMKEGAYDYVEKGGEAGCRSLGLLRQEGKLYVMQDGDVVEFLFNV